MADGFFMRAMNWVARNVTAPVVDNTIGRGRLMNGMSKVGLTPNRIMTIGKNLETGIKQADSVIQSKGGVSGAIEGSYIFAGTMIKANYDASFTAGATMAGYENAQDDTMQHIFNKEVSYVGGFANKAADAGHEALHNTGEFSVAYTEGIAKEAAGTAPLLLLDLPNMGVQYLSGGEMGYEGSAYEWTKNTVDGGFQSVETFTIGENAWERDNQNLQASADMGGFVFDVATIASGSIKQAGKQALKDGGEAMVKQTAKQGFKQTLKKAPKMAKEAWKNTSLTTKVGTGAVTAVVAGNIQKQNAAGELSELLEKFGMNQEDLDHLIMEEMGLSAEEIAQTSVLNKLAFLKNIPTSDSAQQTSPQYISTQPNFSAPDHSPTTLEEKPTTWLGRAWKVIKGVISSIVNTVSSVFGWGGKADQTLDQKQITDEFAQASARGNTTPQAQISPKSIVSAQPHFGQSVTLAEKTPTAGTTHIFDTAVAQPPSSDLDDSVGVTNIQKKDPNSTLTHDVKLSV